MDNWSKALIEITDKLNKNNVSFVLVASGALKVLGVKVTPYDIDIFTSEDNVKKCIDLFNDIKTSDLHYFEDKEGKYIEFQAEKYNTPVEFCELKEFEKIKTKKISYLGTEITIVESALIDELETNKKRNRLDTVKAIEDFIKLLK